jgi:hexosaminidase
VTDQVGIIPAPLESSELDGFGIINANTTIFLAADLKNLQHIQDFLQQIFMNAIGSELEIVDDERLKNQIQLKIIPLDSLGSEGYVLSIDQNRILIQAESSNGLFYGIQSFKQLISSEETTSEIKLQAVKIVDIPRFKWRGMLLDVGRHFMPVKFIKKYIDYLAMHKMNVLQLHLTDDQGWRIEIKRYPELTKVGAWRDETLAGHYRDQPHQFDGKRHGGFYSQEEMKDLVKYAEERFITIVPEIEMPGHARAAIASYPELGCTSEKVDVMKIWGISPYIFNVNDETFEFLENVLSEVIEIFPSDYIHVGGDEAPKDQWESSEAIQEKINTLGLKDEHELQSWFIQRIEKFLNSKGKKLIGWDEILEGGLAPNATVMSWRGEDGGIKAAQMGHDVVMTPTTYCYLDYYQSESKDEPLAIGGFLPIEKVYSYEPIPDVLNKEEAKHILGVQANVWTEYMKTPEDVEYMVFPRIAAIAEIAWSDPGHKNWDDFYLRLKKITKYYELHGINYSTAAFDN